MAISSADEFFAALEKSKLLSAEQVAEARRAAEPSDDAKKVAKSLAKQGVITKWQAGKLLAGATIFWMGKYKLIDLLGRGGMGSVFLAEHVTMNRRVALKVVSRQLSKDRASLDRLLGEARAIAALDHPNIVQAYSVDNEGDLYYIVMEYVAGIDLQHMVERDGPLDYRRAADYVRQAADGLAHAHARKMVHCDIKPSNLLVNNQGVVKILDMGLSRLVGHEDAEQRPDERVLGSVDYLSPEQALGSPDFDHRADIYSLGCTLYFLLVGHPPFPEGTLPERILKHQTAEPRGIRQQRPDTPAELVKICDKMMAKSPADRYQSAADISAALHEWKPSSSQSLEVVPLKADELEDDSIAPLDYSSDMLWSTPSNSPARNGARSSGEMRAIKTATPLVAAAAAAPAKPGLAQTLAWFNTPQRKIAGIVGLAAAAALAIGGVVLLALGLSSRPRDAEHAQAPIQRTVKKEREEYPDLPAVPVKAVEKDNGTKQPAPPQVNKPPVKPTTPTQPPKPPPVTPPKTTPSSTASVKPQPSTPKPEPPKPKPEPPKPQPSNPQPAKPEPPKPPPVKPAPPKKEGPFRDLKSFELPTIPADATTGTETVSFGPVHLRAGDTLSVQVLNSERTGRATPKFTVQPDGDSKEKWRVDAEAAGLADDSPTRLAVAAISLAQGSLNFRWLPDAAQVRAGLLRNCGMLIAAGKDKCFLPLCAAQERPPLRLDIDKGVTKIELKSDLLPEPAALQLQVTGLDKPFPAHDVKISEPPSSRGKDGAAKHTDPSTFTISARGKADILFTDPKLSPFGLRIAFDVKGHLATVNVSAIHKTPAAVRSRDPYKPFVAHEATKIAGELKNLPARWRTAVDAAKTPADRKGAQEGLKQAERDLRQFTAFEEALQKNAALQFRIFTEVGPAQDASYQVDLFRVGAAAAANVVDNPANEQAHESGKLSHNSPPLK
jgi:serine/threonine protein kinase